MPYKIHWKPNYVSFDYFGEVTSEDIIESNKRVYGDSRFDELRWELVSFDDTGTVDFKTTNVRLIAYMDQAAARSNPHITVAFIGKTEILKEVQAAYAKTNMESAWPVIHFDSQAEAIAHIAKHEGAAISRD
jgi:hypothetical protein